MAKQELDHFPPEILGNRYEIWQQLGKQAGRQTLLARDTETQALVVIKRLTFSSDFNWDDLKLFEREIETLQTLSHPAIPRYLDSFEVDTPTGKGFALVQTYIEAKSLEQHLQAGRRFSESEIKQLAQSILEILIYLHGQNPPVIHRDIKPSNILLTQGLPLNQETQISPSMRKIYLVDFGSVQTLATKEGRTVTVVGTYGYMPPEQFGGIAVPASDIYSLGASLIALLTQTHPADLPQKDLQIQFEQAVPISPTFIAWLKRMTAPSLERRFHSAASALQALEQPWRMESNLSIQGQKLVTTPELFWNAVWRSTVIGTLAGTGYGGLYGTVLIPWYGTWFGALMGGCIGLPVGFFNGLLVGTMTRLWYFPLRNTRQYRRTVSFISTLIGTIGGMIGFYKQPLFPVEPNDMFFTIFFVIVPAVIIGLSMGESSKAIARWYESHSQPDEE